jgi:hypothetical protein
MPPAMKPNSGQVTFFTQLTLPPDQPILLLIVVIERETLIDLLKLDSDGHWIENMIRHNPSFVLQEPMTPEMERLLKQLCQITPNTRLDTLLYHMPIISRPAWSRRPSCSRTCPYPRPATRSAL